MKTKLFHYQVSASIYLDVDEIIKQSGISFDDDEDEVSYKVYNWLADHIEMPDHIDVVINDEDFVNDITKAVMKRLEDLQKEVNK